jgi:DNA polymerase III gamma/tau subunit
MDAEGLNVKDEVLEVIAEEAGGSPRQALVYLEACVYCETAADARRVMRVAGQSKEAIDLCQFLLKPNGRTWVDAMKLCKALQGVEAESLRIIVVNYIAAALLGSKSDKKAVELLGIMECFSTPYNTSDKMAPLLHSIGMALVMDR